MAAKVKSAALARRYGELRPGLCVCGEADDEYWWLVHALQDGSVWYISHETLATLLLWPRPRRLRDIVPIGNGEFDHEFLEQEGQVNRCVELEVIGDERPTHISVVNGKVEAAARVHVRGTASPLLSQLTERFHIVLR